MKILDTCFLIHLQREWARKQPGPATRQLERHSGEEFGVSVITAAASSAKRAWKQAARGSPMMCSSALREDSARSLNAGGRKVKLEGCCGIAAEDNHLGSVAPRKPEL